MNKSHFDGELKLPTLAKEKGISEEDFDKEVFLLYVAYTAKQMNAKKENSNTDIVQYLDMANTYAMVHTVFISEDEFKMVINNQK